MVITKSSSLGPNYLTSENQTELFFLSTFLHGSSTHVQVHRYLIHCLSTCFQINSSCVILMSFTAAKS
uniref:Uncharacterized protein n=1 Tax=Populus trichocarpa TaxID=3694 RepID=A0A2K1YLH0_POPTR